MVTKETIIKLEEQLLHAIANKDLAVMDTLIDDSLVFTLPNGIQITKAEDLENIRSGKLIMTSLTWDNFLIHLLEPGDDPFHEAQATANVTQYMEGTFDSHPINGIYRYSRYWKRVQGQWKVVDVNAIETPPALA